MKGGAPVTGRPALYPICTTVISGAMPRRNGTMEQPIPPARTRRRVHRSGPPHSHNQVCPPHPKAQRRFAEQPVGQRGHTSKDDTREDVQKSAP